MKQSNPPAIVHLHSLFLNCFYVNDNCLQTRLNFLLAPIPFCSKNKSLKKKMCLNYVSKKCFLAIKANGCYKIHASTRPTLKGPKLRVFIYFHNSLAHMI